MASTEPNVTTPEETTPPIIEGKTEKTVTNTDVTVDGVVNHVTTTTTTMDIDSDGKVDVVETDVVVKDDNGNIIQSSINVASTMVGLTGTGSLELIPASQKSNDLLREIQALQTKVSCPTLQHLGSMNDYAELFQKAKGYMDTVGDQNINLVIDTSVLDRFATDADIYSQMFQEVQIQFQRMSTVDDTAILTKIRDSLSKISGMYDNINKFHASIVSTSILQIPDSVKTVSESLQSVIECIECSMPYLEFFVDNSTVLSEEQQRRAQLSDIDKQAINSSIGALNTWITMIQNEANVTMSGNAYIQAFKNKIAAFDSLDTRLKTITSKLADKLSRWKSGDYK